MPTIRINETQKINVHRPEAPARPGYRGARHPAVGGADFCLERDGTVDEVLALLKRNGIQPEAGPGIRTCARGPSTSIYFRDPMTISSSSPFMTATDDHVRQDAE
jgi:hypothetical protein